MKRKSLFLVPIPNGIEISPEQKSSYREKVWKIVEQMAGEEILPYVEYEQIFEVDDFKQRYNARNGTALGLAHSMMQTACFRPNNYSKNSIIFLCWTQYQSRNLNTYGNHECDLGNTKNAAKGAL